MHTLISLLIEGITGKKIKGTENQRHSRLYISTARKLFKLKAELSYFTKTSKRMTIKVNSSAFGEMLAEVKS